MSVQSLNGDSYQGGQVGANIQSQVGTSSVQSRSRISTPRPLWERRDPQQLDLHSKAEVRLCPELHINIEAIVSPQLSRRLQTLLEMVQHSSALLTRVHIATGALQLPDLAPVGSDDHRGISQCCSSHRGLRNHRPWRFPFSFGVSAAGAMSLSLHSPFSFQISSSNAVGHS